MYEYGIQFRRVIDGDTFVCDIDLGFGIWLKDQHCRLFGLDTPEKTTPEGKACIETAKNWFKDLADSADTISVAVQVKADKYGRRLVSVRGSKSHCTLNEYLLGEKVAKPYFGGKKG